MNKNIKKSVKIFTFTLVLSLSVFWLLYGLAEVYVNTKNTINKEQIEIINLKQVSYDKAELEVVGRVYNIKLNRDKNLPSLVYTLIPADMELILTALNSAADKIEEIITENG